MTRFDGVALPASAATAAVGIGFMAAAAIARAPRPVRWIVLGTAILVLVLAAFVRQADDARVVLAADAAASCGLAVLITTAGLNRLPRHLARMARAAGAGWGAVAYHALVRPLAGRLTACWAIALLLTASDAGLPARLGLPGAGGPATTAALCAVLGLALMLGARDA